MASRSVGGEAVIDEFLDGGGGKAHAGVGRGRRDLACPHLFRGCVPILERIRRVVGVDRFRRVQVSKMAISEACGISSDWASVLLFGS